VLLHYEEPVERLAPEAALRYSANAKSPAL
jgi:hypothetical protein